MKEIIFEIHSEMEADFPLIFGVNSRSADCLHDIYFHWHENIELIYCAGGEGKILSGTEYIPIRKGELVIVNSGNIHEIFSDSYCKYYYLNPGEALYHSYRIKPNQTLFKSHIIDLSVTSIVEIIIDELENKKDIYYKDAARIECIRLIMYLIRQYEIESSQNPQTSEDPRILKVKKALEYMQIHFREPIQVDDICRHVGFSRYYFSRIFKEITGHTIVRYINQLRCQHARNLIRSGNYTISESAFLSGYQNVSYFTRVYKKCLHSLPSESIK